MTAQLGVGQEPKGHAMQERESDFQQANSPVGPEDLDESWWSAVLTDEPLMEGQTEQDFSPVEEDILFEKHEQSKPLEDWDKVNLLYKNDEITTLKAVGFNRGGILVEGVEIHGFVPASHLIDLPVDIAKDEREAYFCSYLEREISLKVIECDPEKERINKWSSRDWMRKISLRSLP